MTAKHIRLHQPRIGAEYYACDLCRGEGSTPEDVSHDGGCRVILRLAHVVTDIGEPR